MPTVLRFRGLRVVLYPNDHRPAHVHVIGSGYEAVFNLHGPEGPPELRENYGFSFNQATRIKGLIADHLTTVCDKWGNIHGHPGRV
jgi:hypothetical protein